MPLAPQRHMPAPTRREAPVSSPLAVIAFTDSYFIDGDGRPAHHVVNVEVIPAEPLRSYPYQVTARLDELKVSTTEGSDVAEEPYRDEAGFAAANIILVPPGVVGVKRLIGFEAGFTYRGWSAPEFRRHTGDGFDSWEITICFSRGCIPREVSWAEWTSHDTNSTVIGDTVEPLTLEELDPSDPTSPYLAATVHRNDVPADKVYGVFWKW